MSRVRADRYVDKGGSGSPLFPNGVRVTGVATATTFDGNVTGNLTGNVTGNATGLSGTPDITVGTVVSTVITADEYDGYTLLDNSLF